MLAHSVPHMKFPKAASAFLSCVQRYMMHTDDGVPVPQRALKIKQQLELDAPVRGHTFHLFPGWCLLV